MLPSLHSTINRRGDRDATCVTWAAFITGDQVPSMREVLGTVHLCPMCESSARRTWGISSGNKAARQCVALDARSWGRHSHRLDRRPQSHPSGPARVRRHGQRHHHGRFRLHDLDPFHSPPFIIHAGTRPLRSRVAYHIAPPDRNRYVSLNVLFTCPLVQ